MNTWLVATYKINEASRLELNLQNQRFDYYLPKIFLQKLNTNLKEELMFPGYIFINTNLKNYSALKYTKGIKKILKFGDNIPSMSKDDINAIMKIEHESKDKPLSTIYTMGQEVVITEGSFKGNLVKICSLPAAKRIDILINILGSKRKVNIALEDLAL
tara:strand:+ start:56 stop:532 length:477 start_codon:yes stop_codon:yes gene_type:complete